MFRKMDSLLFIAKYKLRAFLTDEDGEVNVVSTVVLIGIAVLLAIIFKDAIIKLIQDLLATITQNAKDAVTKD